MFSVAFFSIASLALSALASPVALSGLPTTPSGVEVKIDRRTAEAADIFAAFCEDFEDRLTKVENIVNGAPDAQTLVATMGPAVLDLIAPMSKFVGQVNVWQTGVSVQGNTVTVNTPQTIKTVNTYAARLTTCLSKASDLVGDQFYELTLATSTVTSEFTAVVTSVGYMCGVALSVLEPVLATLTPLVVKLGTCVTSSLRL